MTPTARVLQSASRWLKRRARKRSGAHTKNAYRDAIAMLNRMVADQDKVKKPPRKA